ncbi:MAG: TPR end-of-group domain-containing protein, partial [Methanococcaceae archaeon]
MVIRLILFCLLAPLFVFGQDVISKDSLLILVTQKSQQANVYWQQGKMKEAVNILESITTLPGIKDMSKVYGDLSYNLACGYSLLDNKEKALYYLNGAVQAGYSDYYENILRDSDLNNIRLDERFGKIIEPLKMSNFKWESSALSTKYHPDLSEDEKVAGLSKVWSETKNSFAYFDHVERLDWDSLYLAYLPEVRKAANIKDYYRILQKMVAQLHD